MNFDLFQYARRPGYLHQCPDPLPIAVGLIIGIRKNISGTEPARGWAARHETKRRSITYLFQPDWSGKDALSIAGESGGRCRLRPGSHIEIVSGSERKIIVIDVVVAASLAAVRGTVQGRRIRYT